MNQPPQTPNWMAPLRLTLPTTFSSTTPRIARCGVSPWVHSWVIAGGLALHCVTFAAAFRLVGPGAAAVSLAPAIAVGALLGGRAGTTMGLAIIAVNALLFRAVGADVPFVSGHVVPGLMTTAVAAVVGRLCDLSAVLRDQRADASRVRDELRTILESLPDAIIVTRSDGAIVFMNRLAHSMFPGPVGSRGAQSSSDLVVPEDRPIVERRRRAAADGRDPGTDIVRALIHGQPRECEIRGAKVEYEGQPATITVLRDVTERLDLERNLARGERMASLGRLAAGVAHEINNPLSYLLSNIRYVRDVMAEHGGEVDWLVEARQVLEEAVGGATQVSRIVQDLRAFTRPKDNVEPVDVHRVLDLAANIASSHFLNRARLVKDYAEVAPVLGDHSRLGQLALNLLVNAAHAIPEGRPSDNEIRIVTRMHEAQHVSIDVLDTGCGIPADVRKHLFEPFFTTKAIGSGTGLGLSICYGIVNSLGGEMSVESEEGKGSRFRVVLPAAKAGPPRA